MKDNNKKPREYRDALSGVYIPEWSELTEDERQEACKEIYVNALNHIYMASAFNEIVKSAIKLDFNDEIIIDSLFKYLYRFVAEDKIRAKDTDRFLEEHPEFKGAYGARYKIGKEFGQAYMDKVKPEFLFKEIKMVNEKQPYTSSFSDEIKAKIDKIKNMSDKELLEVLKDDDKMKELTDIKGDFVIPPKDAISSIEAYAANGCVDLSTDENKLEYAMRYFNNAVNALMYSDNAKTCIAEVEAGTDIVSKFFRMFVQYHTWAIDLEALYLNAKCILIEAGEDIDNKNISQLIINYMQKSNDRVKFCLNQLAEKDKKIHSLNLRISELESDLRISNWLDEEFDKAEAEYENNNHSEEANNTSSSN